MEEKQTRISQSSRFLAILLSLAIVMTGMSLNWVFATCGETSEVSNDSVSVHKTADWVDSTEAKDKGIAKVELTVNADEIPIQIETVLKTRVVLVLDVSSSMTGNKFEKMKTSAKQFVNELMRLKGVEIAIVAYDTNANKKIDFTSSASKEQLISTIDGLRVGRGTNIQDGIRKGQMLLDSQLNVDNKFMVVLSDGEPTSSFLGTRAVVADNQNNYNNSIWKVRLTDFNYTKVYGWGGEHFSSYYVPLEFQSGMTKTDYYLSEGCSIRQDDVITEGQIVYARINNHSYSAVGEAYNAKAKGTQIYSIGFNISANSEAKNVMSCIASEDSKYMLANEATLEKAFTDVVKNIINQAPGSGATVTDIMGSSTLAKNEYKFKAITNDVNFPYEAKAPAGVTGAAAVYDVDTDTFTWTLSDGDLKEGIYSLTYYVDMNIENMTGDYGIDALKVLTNNDATLKYTDENGSEKSLCFNKPGLDITHYKVEYYYGDGDNFDNYELKPEKTYNASAIVGCSDIQLTDNLKAKGKIYGYDFVKASADKLTIVQDQESNVLKLYYKKYHASGSANITAKKEYNKTLTGSGVFNFKLEASDASGNVLTSDNTKYQTQASNNISGVISFPEINYTEESIGKTYYYKISEIPDSAKPYIEYSKDEYLATVVVTDKPEHNGELAVNVSYSKMVCGELQSVDSATFVNNYSAKEGKFAIEMHKVLTGKTLQDKQFTFKMIEVNKDGTDLPLAQAVSVTNDADGIIEFPTLQCTKDGEVHYYKIWEENGGQKIDGITYDNMKAFFKVDAHDNDEGEIVAHVSYPEDKIFNNSYSADSTEVGLTVFKELSGKKIKPEQFEFTLNQTDEDGNIIKGGTNLTAMNDTDNHINFENIKYDKPGKYYYLITENNGGNRIAGITYDDMKCRITVNVEDYGKGQLVAHVSYPEDKIFNNSYSADPTEVSLEAKKELEGQTLNSGEFDFTLNQVDSKGELIEEGTTLTSSNDEDGNVRFDSIKYDDPGYYYYQISENKGGQTLDGITYDDLKSIVKVHVVDNGKGQLEAKVFYPEDSTFNNIYKASNVGVVIKATKDLDGRKLKAGEFNFELVEVRDDDCTTDLPIMQPMQAQNDQCGNIEFDQIDYSQPGIYKYIIVEKNGGKKIDNVTYDSMQIPVTVTVTDNGKGQLEANVEYGDDTEFNNIYKKPIIVKPTKVITEKINTGDEANIALWIILLITTTCASTVIVALKRKEDDK